LKTKVKCLSSVEPSLYLERKIRNFRVEQKIIGGNRGVSGNGVQTG
jgi:hypothetical protein